MAQEQFDKLVEEASKLTPQETLEAMVNPYEHFEKTYPYIDTSNLTVQHKGLLDWILMMKKENNEHHDVTEEALRIEFENGSIIQATNVKGEVTRGNINKFNF